ncbi:MAG: peptidoglycan DD-metalloendopeptidase family protein [Alphaproteobacteria bacterium]|nr:peptidoglycan DD-metalloendopeptidase family protein [Alphaproteobacteria bacterium]
MLRLSLFFCALLLMLSPFALAQDKKTRQDLVKVEEKISERQAAAKDLDAKEKATEAELAELRRKLIAATVELQTKQTEQDDFQQRTQELEKEAAARAQALVGAQSRLAALTSTLIQVSRDPPEIVVLREETTDDVVHRAILLRALLPRLKAETAILAHDIEAFEDVRRRAATQKKMLERARQNLEWQRRNLDKLVHARQDMLKQTAQEKEAMAAQLERLTKEAKNLRQLMERVSTPSWERTVSAGRAARLPDLKTGIKQPAVGKIIRRFGDKDEFGISSEGITIAAAAAAPVVAPQSGKVVFAGPFEGYGKIIILQHARGYHTFLAGFDQILAAMGQTIEAGEPLGLLPPSPQGKAELYFEWRKNNQPVNPLNG